MSGKYTYIDTYILTYVPIYIYVYVYIYIYMYYTSRLRYVWNRWNQIDLLTVILGWLGVMLSTAVNLNVLRPRRHTVGASLLTNCIVPYSQYNP